MKLARGPWRNLLSFALEVWQSRPHLALPIALLLPVASVLAIPAAAAPVPMFAVLKSQQMKGPVVKAQTGQATPETGLSEAETLLYGAKGEGDPAKAETILKQLVKEGDAAAKLVLGKAYLDASTFKKKSQSGIQLLEEAGSQGRSDAYSFLGEMFLWGTAELKPDAARALTYLEKAAAAENKNGLRTLGEQLVTGWVLKPDVPRGEAILKALKDKGDAQAGFILGRAYLEVPALKDKVQQGVQLVDEAGISGNAEANFILGNAFLWGSPELKPDAVKTQAYLEKAAAAGNKEGLRLLGEQLVTGWVLPRDTDRGLAMLERLSDQGDAKAQYVLGRILLNGEGAKRDVGRGRKLLESAARKRVADALEVLGTDMMWNGKSQADANKARDYLTRAAKAGRKQAWLTLAEGASFKKFGAKGEAAYPEYEKEARKAGLERIDVLRAQRRLWGIGGTRSTRSAIRHLEQSASRGNVAALTYLVELVRDGDGGEIAKNSSAAKRYLQKYGASLPPGKVQQELILIEAARSRTPPEFAELAAAVRQQPDVKTAEFVRRLFKINPNLALYLAQIVLKENGNYNGKLHGLATRATIAAMREACQGKLAGINCTGPLIGAEIISQIAVR